MRTRKAAINMFFFLLMEAATLVYGFTVPRLLITTYGSMANGLVSSITNFLSYILLLQSGVGGVVRAALYKPLADKNHHEVSVVIKTTERFFRKIAVYTMAYMLILALVYPFIIEENFDFWFTASMVLIIGVGTAAQYFFGLTYQLLLDSDQRSYIHSIVQLISTVLNTVLVVVLVRRGASIHMVKLATAFIFTIRPLVVNYFVNRRYKLLKDVKPDNELIKQRWDATGQTVAYFIQSRSDIFWITIMSTLTNVSIYSVYALITNGLQTFLSSLDRAVRGAFGEMLARKEQKNLIRTYHQYALLMHIASVVMYATAAVTALPFVEIYTRHADDAAYNQPLFSALFIFAALLYCLRIPYSTITFAAGKYRETKKDAYLEALVNVLVTFALIQTLGLVGVAIGSITAIALRTVRYANFLHHNLLWLSYRSQIKQYLLSIITFAAPVFAKYYFYPNLHFQGFFSWLIFAALVFLCTGLFALLMAFSFDRKNLVGLVMKYKSVFSRKRL